MLFFDRSLVFPGDTNLQLTLSDFEFENLMRSLLYHKSVIGIGWPNDIQLNELYTKGYRVRKYTGCVIRTFPEFTFNFYEVVANGIRFSEIRVVKEQLYFCHLF